MRRDKVKEKMDIAYYIDLALDEKSLDFQFYLEFHAHVLQYVKSTTWN